jgi:tetratricopeptide (TPR) repeat protein
VTDTRKARRVGTIMRLVSLPFVLLLVAFGVKVIAMAIIGALAAAAYDSGDYERSAQYSRWNLTANLFEPHKAHFGLGTSYLQLGLYDEARDELELALETAPLPDSCDVRLNLSYALEGLGDRASEAGEFQLAIEYYQEALTVLQEADESCPPSEERQDELSEKLQQAQQNADDQGNPPGGGQNPQDPGDGDEGDEQSKGPLGDLEDLLEEAQRNKEQSDAADRAHDNFDDFVDKPW